MGPTGGYIIGFLATALIMWGFEKFFGKNKVSFIISAIIGLIACYALGTVWFMKVFSAANGPIGLAATLGMCVVPFIIPDLIKLVAAYLIGSKIYRLTYHKVKSQTNSSKNFNVYKNIIKKGLLQFIAITPFY